MATATSSQIGNEQGKVARLIDAMMNRLLPLWDAVMIFEPERWIIALTAVAAGQGAVHSSNQQDLFWHISYNFGTFWHYLSVCLIMAAAGIIRQLSRRRSQMDPGPGNRLSELESGGRKLTFIAWSLFAVGLASMALTGPLGVLFGAALFFTAGGIEGTTAGSTKPVRPLRIFEYTGTGLLLLLLGWELAGGSYGAAWEMLAPYAAVIIAITLLLVMEPVEPASEAAVVNPQSAYGLVLLAISTGLMAVAVAGGYANGDPVVSTAAIISLPFYVIAIIYRRPADLSRGIRYTIIILIIFTGARYPLIYPPVFLVYYVARFYYARRYHFGFPAFAPESEN